MILASNQANKIVYDCIDPSPFYDSPQDPPYLDENDLVEIPQEDAFSDQKKYPYGPNNSLSPYISNINNRGIRINRFYSKL
jgi:hypothetical protein